MSYFSIKHVSNVNDFHETNLNYFHQHYLIMFLFHFIDATKLKGDNGEPLGTMLQDCAHVGLCTDFYNKSSTWTVPVEEVLPLLL